jgi:hypothetical protein
MGLMQLEEAYTIEVIKLPEYIKSKEDSLTQIVRTHKTQIAILQTAVSLKKELQKGTRQIKDMARKTKENIKGKDAWTIPTQLR